MILYVNGDSHSAGAEINNTYCFAKDDPLYFGVNMPHPDNIPNSFGGVLAQKINYSLWLDANSGSSNDCILRKTQNFIKSQNTQDIFLLIGWSSFEREERLIDNEYYQFSPGFDCESCPENVKTEYKNYIVSYDQNKILQKNKYWHQTVWDFHLDLQQKEIKHLFFNSYMEFIIPKHEQLDWGNSFIGCYNHTQTYWRWLENNKYKTVNNGYHYGADAHAAWADRLYKWLTDHQLL